MSIGPITSLSPVPDAGDATRVSAGAAVAPPSAPLTRAAVAQVTSARGVVPELPRPRSAASPSRERHITIDPATSQVVSQVLDRETGELLSQVPDQALLRLKAYARELVAELDAREAARRVERIA